MITTRFSRACGIRTPIASAGMAFVGSSSELAVAVARAGGLGAIGVGLTSPGALRSLIAEFRAQTNAPLNINLLTPFTEDDYIDLLVETGPEVVSFHWGHPSRGWIERLHSAGTCVWEQVGSAEAAEMALDDGVDLLVVQGTEAGGHNFAELPIFVAIPEVGRAVGAQPLLLAAGGICSGAAMAAALALGADGVWIGSRLVASEEGNAHYDYKRALVESAGSDTRLTSMFGRAMPEFNPMRVVANRVVREWEGREHEMPPETAELPLVGSTVLNRVEVPLRRFTSFVPTREMVGNTQEMPFLAGAGIGQIEAVQPVDAILAEFIEEAEAVIGSLAQTIDA